MLNLTKYFSKGANTSTINHIVTPVRKNVTTVLPERAKSDIAVVKINPKAQIITSKSNSGLKIKDLNNNLVPLTLDYIHTGVLNLITNTIDRVATSAKEYPKGNKNACLNPNKQLNGGNKAQYIAETQVTIHTPREAVIIDEERTRALLSEENRHMFRKICRDAVKQNKTKPSVIIELAKADETTKEK